MELAVDARDTAGAGRPAAAWTLLVAGLAAAYVHTFAEMWRRWFPAWRYRHLSLYDRIVEGESYYTHGPLIPVISLLTALVLIRHTRIPVRPARPLGWTVLGLSLLAHLAGSLARITFVSGFSLIGVLAGLILLLWGRTALRRLWFPLALLLFMVPLPEVSISQLNFRLKMIAAEWGVRVAQALGVVVAQNGNQVWIEGGKTMVVANVCNGLRTLISLLAFGAVYTYVCRLRGGWRVGLFLLTVPVAVVANSARIVSLIAVADAWDVQTATGWYHDTSGVLIFVLAFLMLYGLERLILGLRAAAGRPARVEPLFAGVERGPQDERQWSRMVLSAGARRGWAAAAAIAVVAVAAWWFQRTVPSGWTGQLARAALPSTLSTGQDVWLGTDDRLTEQQLIILETTDHLFRHYAAVGQPRVDFLIVFSQDNRKGTHPPDVCLEGEGQNIVHAGDVRLGAVPGRGAVPCRELRVTSSRGSVYHLYTYKCGERYTPSFWMQQWTILWNGLLDRDASGALIRVSTVIEDGDPDADAARRRAAEIMRAAIPHLDRNLVVARREGA